MIAPYGNTPAALTLWAEVERNPNKHLRRRVGAFLSDYNMYLRAIRVDNPRMAKALYRIVWQHHQIEAAKSTHFKPILSYLLNVLRARHIVVSNRLS